MEGQCNNPQCEFPDLACDMGYMSATNCEHFEQKDEKTTSDDITDESVFPWTGRTFGLHDLHFVAGRRKPQTIGIIGSQNAGKTTLLATLYLMLYRGQEVLQHHRFAGSFTLEGWESVAKFLQFGPGQPIAFPPHTASRSNRAPGLLHLNLQSNERVNRDYLFTDAPGEWFRKWAVNEEAVEVEGARWVARHADKLLLIADREALGGSSKGKARSDLQLLARRLAGVRDERPVALVWTKSDITIDADLRSAIRNFVFELFSDAAEFSVQVPPLQTEEGTETGIDLSALRTLFDWAMTEVPRQGSLLKPKSLGKDDLFFSYGAV